MSEKAKVFGSWELGEYKHCVILVIGFIILIVRKTNEKPVTKYEKQNKSTDLTDLTKYVQCSNECQKEFLYITILNGDISCERDIVHVQCQIGFDPGENISVDCDKFPEMLDSLQCTKRLWHKTESRNQPDVLIVAGGEKEDKMVNTVEVFPPSPESSCLPNLPKALKWGSMGMLGETLLVCGGQNEAEQPSQACWTLGKEDAQWKPHNNLARPRSQSASTVSEDGSLLHILSGYGTRESGRSIYSMQSMGLKVPNEEHTLDVSEQGRTPYHSRLASAVTLTGGDVLVTGGRGTEDNVYLLTGEDWVPRQRMLQARCAHSSIRIMLGSEEHVMVAGGWDGLGLALDSVELYSVGQDSWLYLQSLPSPRVDFTLQVLNSKISAVGGYDNTHKLRNYPEEATISWTLAEGWSQWVEEEQGSFGHRNGFMAAKVSLSWVKQLC